jgi:hypothetical protein
MKCRIAKKLTFEFVDGLEDDTKRLELEKHVAECKDCDKFATQLTRSLDLLHRAPQETTGDNFAWNVRLKLNQERVAARTGSVSYGTIIRSWNLRYATAAVAAAAVVLVGGLFVMDYGVTLVSTQGEDAPRVATGETPAPRFGSSSPDVAAAIQRPTPTPVSDPVTSRSGQSIEGPPQFRTNTRVGLVDWSTSRNQSPGRFIGVDLIDRYEPLSVTQMDSLVHTQLDNLSADEQVRYLSQYIIMLQQHLLKAHLNRNAER